VLQPHSLACGGVLKDIEGGVLKDIEGLVMYGYMMM